MNGFSYRGLCISSGGYRGLGILGALAALDIAGVLKDVNRFAGCSVGSVLTLLLACGWKPIELYRRIVNLSVFKGLADINFDRLKTRYGLISNEPLRVELEQLVLEKKKKIPTLLEFNNDGIYLAFSICDRRNNKGVKLDFKTYPLLSSVDACLMSSNIPFIFPPIDFDNMLVVDGALTNPFPIDYLDNGKDAVLGIAVYGKNASEDSFLNYVVGTIMIQIEEMQRMLTKHASLRVDVLEMVVQELSYFDSNHSYLIKNDIFFKGYHDGQILISALQKKFKHERRQKRRSHHAQKAANSSSKGSEQPAPTEERLPTEPIKTPNLKGSIYVNLRRFPAEVVVKCLMSQPLDILAQTADNQASILQHCFKLLDRDKTERLRKLARELIADELKSGVRVTYDNAKEDNPDSTNVKVKENYSQKIYDTLPTQFKAAAKVMVDSMGEKEASRTIAGVNIIIEGLRHLGVDIFGGFLLGGSSSTSTSDFDNNNNEPPAQDKNPFGAPGSGNNPNMNGRVEIMEDEPVKTKIAMDDVD